MTAERGALPLLAFAVAQLWERRDRETGLLTRAAYRAVGGVGGALAQHAEKTITDIGEDRIEHVREIFRNLVTAQGTRAVCEMDELLSVFPDRTEGHDALKALIDARLLTSYEVWRDHAENEHRKHVAYGHNPAESNGVPHGAVATHEIGCHERFPVAGREGVQSAEAQSEQQRTDDQSGR